MSVKIADFGVSDWKSTDTPPSEGLVVEVLVKNRPEGQPRIVLGASRENQWRLCATVLGWRGRGRPKPLPAALSLERCLRSLETAAADTDLDRARIDADNALCRYLQATGRDDIVEAFLKIEK